MEQNEKLFYVGLKAFIASGDKLLIFREAEYPNAPGVRKWEIPGGRIQHSEIKYALIDVLLREVREECGESLQIKVGEMFYAFRRQFPDGSWVFLAGYDCQYISGEVKLSHEHTDFAWIEEKDLRKYDFVNGYKEAITEYFRKKKS